MKGKMMPSMAIVCALYFLSPALGIAQAQAPKEAQRAILVNVAEEVSIPIMNAGSGTIAIPVEIEYQQVLTDHFVLSAIPGLVLYGYSGGLVLQFQPWVEVDWHPFDLALKGFYVGLAAAGVVSWDFRPSGANQYFVGVAPAIGYQFLLTSHIDLDLGFGWAFPVYSVGIGMFARGEIGLGYRF